MRTPARFPEQTCMTKDPLPPKRQPVLFLWEENEMIENWNDVHIVPEFCDQGVDCYRLAGGSFLNEYYIVSEAETRKLMNHPEVVGYEVYASLVTATSQMMYYLKEQKKITSGEHSLHPARRAQLPARGELLQGAHPRARHQLYVQRARVRRER